MSRQVRLTRIQRVVSSRKGHIESSLCEHCGHRSDQSPRPLSQMTMPGFEVPTQLRFPLLHPSISPAPLPAAEEKKKLAEEKAMEIEEQNKIIAVEKAEAETALAEVMPILEAAKLELQKLDKSDVTEIRYALPRLLPPTPLELTQGLSRAHPPSPGKPTQGVQAPPGGRL